jgi:CheY-like chemotaxis protein
MTSSLLEAIRQTIALRLRNVHVDVSASAQEALTLLAAQPYAVALCCTMPVMDGHQFLAHAHRLCPDMPVLLISGPYR